MQLSPDPTLKAKLKTSSPALWLRLKRRKHNLNRLNLSQRRRTAVAATRRRAAIRRDRSAVADAAVAANVPRRQPGPGIAQTRGPTGEAAEAGESTEGRRSVSATADATDEETKRRGRAFHRIARLGKSTGQMRQHLAVVQRYGPNSPVRRRRRAA